MILERLLGRSAAITTSSALYKLLSAGYESDAGVTVTPESAMRQSVVYACVRAKSETVGATPLVFYRRMERGKQRAFSNRLYSLLHDAPNDFQTSMQFRETITAHKELRGVGYAFINRSITGEILELLPMHPDRVQMRQNKDYSLEYTLTDADGAQIPLTQDQVFRVTGLSFDGVNGLSPIAYHAQTIGISLAADKHSAMSFKNGSKLNVVLKHPATFKNDDVARRVKESWEEATTGDNSYKTAVLEDGMDVVPVSMTAKDAQFIERQQFQAEDIARIWRMPPHKVGILQRSTNNNIEHQGHEFYQDTMLPDFVRWEQSIWRDLLTKTEKKKYFAEFIVDGMLRGNAESRGEFYSKLFNMAAISPNEIREKENMNPRGDGDGDTYFNPLNMGSSGGQNDEQ